MDETLLNARSIELAERAYRQKARAENLDTRQRLDDVGDELIRLGNSHRFYLAQSMFENSSRWSEEERALAHEINVAYQAQHLVPAMSFSEATKLLTDWAAAYNRSDQDHALQVGYELTEALKVVTANEYATNLKQAYNYMLAVVEIFLTQVGDKQAAPDINHKLTLLRSLRDAILVSRALAVDVGELLREDMLEDEQFDVISTAQDVLVQIYETIEPVTIPRFDR